MQIHTQYAVTVFQGALGKAHTSISISCVRKANSLISNAHRDGLPFSE